MRHLKLLSATIFSACLLFACSSNSSSTAGKSDASNSASNSSGDSTYSGNSSLAYTIEGRHVAIKDLMQDCDGKNYMALFINKVTNEPGGRVNVDITNELSQEVFKFSIANTGATTILHYSPTLANFSVGIYV